MRTRLRSNIKVPKQYIDGTVRYSLNKRAFLTKLTTHHEVLTGPKWREAIQAEFHALQKNSTWELVPRKHGHNIVDCKWIFKTKYKTDGIVDRYQARLVAKGFGQRLGIQLCCQTNNSLHYLVCCHCPGVESLSNRCQQCFFCMDIFKREST